MTGCVGSPKPGTTGTSGADCVELPLPLNNWKPRPTNRNQSSINKIERI